MSYLDAEDTGLLSFYLLYSPPRPEKLTRCERLLSTRALTLIILATGCTEINPGKFFYHDDFGYHHKLLADRLLSQGYEVKRLRNSFKKFYGRYPDLIGKYQRSVKDMVADSFPD